MGYEKRKEYYKKRYEKNKEKIKEKVKKYQEENKEKIKEKVKKYQEENKEKIKEKQKKYNQTEKGKEVLTIARWMQQNIISNDYPALYKYYKSCKNCENCGIELVEGNYGSNKKCLDHDHITGLFRNVLCQSCNVKRREKIPLTQKEINWKRRLKQFILS